MVKNMSDPVTSAEIEDVLSSIRKLVSNEERAERPAEASQEPEGEKLVLTPSLRVDDSGADEAEPVIADEIPEFLAKKPQGTGGADDDRQDQSDSKNDDPRDVSAAPEQDEDDLGADETVSDTQELGDDATDEDESADAGDEEPDDEDEVDNSEDSETSQDEDGWQEVSEPVSAEADDAYDNDTDEGRPEDRFSGLDRNALKQRVAEFEAAVASRDDQWEPDGDSGDEYAGGPVEPLPWQDEVPGAPPSEPVSPARDPFAERDVDRPAMSIPPRQERPGSAQFDAESLADEEDAILDEEALRDMVSEIVRQELQGALGERITRNVRKLVRREIHRALTSQQFD